MQREAQQQITSVSLGANGAEHRQDGYQTGSITVVNAAFPVFIHRFLPPSRGEVKSRQQLLLIGVEFRSFEIDTPNQIRHLLLQLSTEQID